jgi:ubiquinone/menaquinone biosynthesis C-methylase UbiE
MPVQNERVSGMKGVPIWVWHEHLARYEFASRFVQGKVVVDCACGAGIGSRRFGEAGAQQILAFDCSEDSLAVAQAAGQIPNVRFATSSALKLPLPDASAEIYISLETIEHIEDDRGFLAEAHRVLKPGGTFICSTANRTVTNPGKTLADKPWNKFHVREYSREEFADLLSSRFASVEMYGQNPRSPWRTKLMYTLGRVLPLHGAVRINQMFKVPYFLLDRPEQHVVEREAGRIMEYVLAVCRRT